MTSYAHPRDLAPIKQSTTRRRGFLHLLSGGLGAFLLSGRLSIAFADNVNPTAAATPGALAAPTPDAHFPSFTIDPNGIVRRSLSATAVLPSAPTVLNAPYFSQFDGSVYAESNCGPTSLAMALGALGVPATQLALRALANQHMGTSDPNNGTSWESLEYAAKQNGVSASGLMNPSGSGYRQWSIANLTSELAIGHPVLILVRYWDLPEHKGSSFSGDHYIVALGTDEAGNIIFNDPAATNGANLKISPSQLLTAWRDPESGLKYTAMALSR